MRLEYFKLQEVIENSCSEFKNCKVYYLTHPGNWGDAVLRVATLKFLRDIPIDFTEVSSMDYFHDASEFDSSFF